VRVILVVVACDKPAAHKIGGFGGHSHTWFCTACWISKQDKATAASFEKDGTLSSRSHLLISTSFSAFPIRTDEEHRYLGEQYRRLTTKTERARFAKAHATRFTQFSRLPYFDTVRQIVIDPMHNLLLGVPFSSFTISFDTLPFCRPCQDTLLPHMGSKQDLSRETRVTCAS